MSLVVETDATLDDGGRKMFGSSTDQLGPHLEEDARGRHRATELSRDYLDRLSHRGTRTRCVRLSLLRLGHVEKYIREPSRQRDAPRVQLQALAPAHSRLAARQGFPKRVGIRPLIHGVSASSPAISARASCC